MSKSVYYLKKLQDINTYLARDRLRGLLMGDISNLASWQDGLCFLSKVIWSYNQVKFFCPVTSIYMIYGHERQWPPMMSGNNRKRCINSKHNDYPSSRGINRPIVNIRWSQTFSILNFEWRSRLRKIRRYLKKIILNYMDNLSNTRLYII